MVGDVEPRGFFDRYGARLIGAGCGALIGVLLLTIGILKTLLLVVLASIGWWLGARLDGRWLIRMKNVMRRVFRDED